MRVRTDACSHHWYNSCSCCCLLLIVLMLLVLSLLLLLSLLSLLSLLLLLLSLMFLPYNHNSDLTVVAATAAAVDSRQNGGWLGGERGGGGGFRRKSRPGRPVISFFFYPTVGRSLSEEQLSVDIVYICTSEHLTSGHHLCTPPALLPGENKKGKLPNGIINGIIDSSNITFIVVIVL